MQLKRQHLSADLNRILACGEKHLGKYERRIALAGGPDAPRYKIMEAQHALFRKRSFRTLAVYTAAMNRRPRRQHPLPSEDEMRVVAAEVNVFRPSPEPVEIIRRPKGNGEFRKTFKYGIRQRAAQHMVGMALSPLTKPAAKGILVAAGPAEATRLVKSSFEDGYKWGIPADIRRCFLSFEGWALLDELPLPKRVTENVVLAPTVDQVSGRCHGSANRQANGYTRRMTIGAPEGSAASAFVAKHTLVPNLPACEAGVRIIVYADDFLLLARRREDAVRTFQSLQAYLEEGGHPVGFFRLTDEDIVRRADWGFWFLKRFYRFRKGTLSVHAGPRLEERLRSFDALLADPEAFTGDLFTELRQRQRGYLAAYRDTVEASAIERLGERIDIAERTGRDPGPSLGE